ncbi:hypothetical protein AJ80_04631 [Polytolypa hystricis UAMH7299]|uniref:Uncharacterized protein n=1 Tax=Polytolypa hystricis (strain UAMH7299) TaxID=1447883 RepID=A0A2B7Y9Y9_POLH7|nr:hypothetical protein AJ80_04631 [Polytolypa hystricis UAMH7299]
MFIRSRLLPTTLRQAFSTYEHLRVAGFTQDPKFFRYTRGRFVRDEAFEMARRSIHFNVVAASAVGSTACVKFEK